MANKKISDMTAATSLASGDLFEIETSGGASRKMTAANAHADLVSKTSAGTITAVHALAPGSTSAPFTLGANAVGQLVNGLAANYLNTWVLTANTSAVASTTTETALGTGPTIDANAAYLVSGTTFDVEIRCVYNTTGSPTGRFRLRVGGVSGSIVFDTGAITLVTGATSASFIAKIQSVIRTPGASTAWSHGHQISHFPAAPVVTVFNTASSPTGIDHTSTKVLQPTWEWGTSSASNTLVMSAFTVRAWPPQNTL